MEQERYSNILVEFFERLSSWEQGMVSDRDISLAQMHLLEVVGNHGQLRMKELSETLGVTTGTLTVMVHRLEAAGFLRRKKNAQDRRSYIVELTEAGDREYENHHHMHMHLIEEITDGLSPQESENLFSLLDRVKGML